MRDHRVLSVDERAALLEQHGVDRGLVISSTAPEYADLLAAWEQMLRMVEKELAEERARGIKYRKEAGALVRRMNKKIIALTVRGTELEDATKLLRTSHDRLRTEKGVPRDLLPDGNMEGLIDVVCRHCKERRIGHLTYGDKGPVIEPICDCQKNTPEKKK